MDALFLVLAGAEIFLFAAIYLLGAGYVRRGFTPGEHRQDPPAAFQPAALLVPATGDSPVMRRALASLLAQDHPDLEVIFAVASTDDPAFALISGLIQGHPRARLVTAGQARTSCQKNHNLLAALEAVSPGAARLVFCDSTHLARPDLVRRLCAPIERGETALASGFHQVVPGDFSRPVLAMTWTVLAVHLLQAAPFLSQPWGGAMAVDRAVFLREGVPGLWRTAIVDDFTMGPLFASRGLRCAPVAAACMDTPLAGLSLAAYRGFWFRQLQYLKFCIPPLWLAAALGIAALAAPLVLGPLYALAGIFGLVPPLMGLAGAGHILLLCALMAYYRRLVPVRVPFGPWIASGFFFLAETARLYAATWTTNRMTWRGIAYDVALGGKVKRVIRD